jgi:N-methylhydantoinase A/oxoprolinase/acetone carboxylase beta subunit
LGLISPDNFLGGRRRMNIDSARRSIEETVAQPLKSEIDGAALEIRSVLAENLARSIRAEAKKRSFPMQDAVMFAYGGGGALHAAEIAAAAGVSTFYMFPESPVFSAAGLSSMDVQHFYESRLQPTEGENIDQALKRVASGLRDRAHRDMRGEGFDPAMAKLLFVLDSPDGKQYTFDDMALDATVSEAASGGLLRLMATIESGGPDDALAGIVPPASQASGAEREIGWVDGRSMTAVYSYPELETGERIDGPALVETAETSCVIPQQWSAETDTYGALKVWRV